MGRTLVLVAVAALAGALRAPAGLRAPPLMRLLSPSPAAVAKKVATTSYDYIIAGGGTAGCVLANRLSEDPSKKVLVLEAGDRGPNSPLVKIPVAILKLFKSAYDWNFATKPSEAVADRSLYVCRGKGLGGSSLTNVMLYNRGSANDYDAWAAACGDDSWGAEEMLGYFKKAEDCLVPAHRANHYHGVGGPYASSHVPYTNEMSTAFVDSVVEDGGVRNGDFNDWSTSQVGFGRFAVSQRKGARVDAATAYLPRKVRRRKNLDVVRGAALSGVTWNANKATGVEFAFGGVSGIACGGEVILSGGAVHSPQMLMLSGVGAKAQLEEFGIPVVADRPGVGKNLQDHPACLVGAGDGDCDVQFRFLATSITPDGMSTISDSYEAAVDHPDGLTIQTIVARPKSRAGEALQKARSIASRAPLSAYAGHEEFPGGRRDERQLAAYVRNTAHTANAVVRTCKMGESSDALAVVDNHLKVIGVSNLRVVDASVMPTLPGGQTAARPSRCGEGRGPSGLTRRPGSGPAVSRGAMVGSEIVGKCVLKVSSPAGPGASNL
ncbi:hypothetical protein JL722_6008 [Aureococcus anophagefferens]|nr:hypothetical protein JL722_6008 [Aureococcus anophagefferens]